VAMRSRLVVAATVAILVGGAADTFA